VFAHDIPLLLFQFAFKPTPSSAALRGANLNAFWNYQIGKGLGKNKSSSLAGLFGHLLRHGKSFIALLCASFHSSNMTKNPAHY
jgi:hypothetical protein